MKPIDFRIFRTNWIPDFLPIGSLWLETSATALCGPYVTAVTSSQPLLFGYLFCIVSVALHGSSWAPWWHPALLPSASNCWTRPCLCWGHGKTPGRRLNLNLLIRRSSCDYKSACFRKKRKWIGVRGHWAACSNLWANSRHLLGWKPVLILEFGYHVYLQ